MLAISVNGFFFLVSSKKNMIPHLEHMLSRRENGRTDIPSQELWSL